MTTEQFQQSLLGWFDREGRKHLPWQHDPAPYRVWVSEIMLQQTQVATAIPYYLRFMQSFPDLPSLAAADLNQVLEHWAGLGYYARARNLHRAARIVVERHAGQLPGTLDEIASLPGIGRSTAGAILSMGFGVPAPILDGNVKRVLARHGGIEGWPGESTVLRRLWELAERLTPQHRVGAYTQAIMDLGATLCTPRNPDCGRCPVQAGCSAHRTDAVERLPTPKPRKTLPIRTVFMLALRNGEDAFYLERRPPVGIWGGLWSLPEFADRNELESWCRVRSVDPASLETQPVRRHTFSHYHLDYVPVAGVAAVTSRIEDSGRGAWRRIDAGVPLPAPISRLLKQIRSSNDQRTP